MKAIEFNTKIHSHNTIEIPASYLDQLKSDQKVRVIVLIDDTTDEESWRKYTTTQFFSGYSNDDSIYDEQ